MSIDIIWKEKRKLMNKQRKEHRQRGFTMAELLLTVAILVILMAIAAPQVFTIQRNLRQKELDSKAETVYMAVQSRLTELYASGKESAYSPEQVSAVRCMGEYPADYDEDNGTRLNEDSIYYFVSGDNQAAQSIVNADTLKDELAAGHWVVELIPYAYREEHTDPKVLSAPSVYAVYYSEDRIDVSQSYATGGTVAAEYVTLLRSKENRIKAGAKVGYYGGSATGSGSATTALSLETVKLNSDEEIMTAVVKCKKPSSISEPLQFRFVLEDTQGHQSVVFYNESNNSFTTKEGYLYQKGNIELRHVGINYTFTLTLDDLSKASSRFWALYGERDGLVCGSDIRLTVTASCPTNHTVEKDSKSAVGNSLFSYVEGDEPTLAVLKCGRHLQNLDESSHVSSELTCAQQVNTISFAEGSQWLDAYGESYFHGEASIARLNRAGTLTQQVPNFKPIQNDFLTRYDSEKQYSIEELTAVSQDALSVGLFETLGAVQVEVNNAILTGTRLATAGDAGGIVGTVTGGAVTLNGCQLYLDRVKGDIPNSISQEGNTDSVRWLQGKYAGGLVGNQQGTLTLENCSASTVVEGSCAGGLVGKSTGTVALKSCYADCYLYGGTVGGLIGESTGDATLDVCYAAGFIGLSGAKGVGAGLVNGTVSRAQSVYTLVAPYAMAKDKGIDKTGGKVAVSAENTMTYYSTAQNIQSAERVFYFNGSVNAENVSKTSCINERSSEALQTALGAESGFEVDTNGTEPYNLMGQALSRYTYPRLKELAHYGDWEAEFQQGALVYYEAYADNTYGFEGANADNTLSDEGQIVGDGYGVVLLEGSSFPETVTVSVDKKKVLEFHPNTEKSYYTVKRTVGKQAVTYRIYPLPTEQVNPTHAVEGYYQRATISQSITGGGESNGYFDYNPHFARTVQETQKDAAVSKLTGMISVRSPRHLYALSRYYDNGYRESTTNQSYMQERELDYAVYQWEKYSDEIAVTEQQPIGADKAHAFRNTYNGGCYAIEHISFVTEKGYYVGLFGATAEQSTLKNIVLVTDYHKKDENYFVQRKKAAQVNETVYYGVLSAWNAGQVNNCAVAGYYLAGSDGTIHGYANSTAYIGGLIGWNEGIISNCAADAPRLRLSMYRATCYAGGLTGWNSKNIYNCYALNHIDSTAQGGATHIAGFSAGNVGIIRQSYCATALTAAGTGTKSYAFVPQDSTGITSGCYYLHAGNYQFVDGLYAYDLSEALTLGTGRTYEQLAKGNTAVAKRSLYHRNTTALNDEEQSYPYRAIVTDAQGEYIHYGEWQVKPVLGSLGLFYWEHEIEGQNNGYKMTFIGTNEGKSVYQTNLCGSHDDGGIIAEYGYGYYVRKGEEDEVQSLPDASSIATSGTRVDKAAQTELEKQMKGYTFYPYTTRDKQTSETDYICLTGAEKQGIWTLRYRDKSYRYALTPLFANAMQFCGSGNYRVQDAAGGVTDYTQEAGEGRDNVYEIRSIQQLQYINWNSATQTATEYLKQDWFDGIGDKVLSESVATTEKAISFPYLGYSYCGQTIIDTKEKIRENLVHHSAKLYWRQSHDLDAQGESFAPVGSLYDSNATNTNQTEEIRNQSYVQTAYFNGCYLGDSYTIRNVEIDSPSQVVGLFGITVGAKIDSLILYSDQSSTIATKEDGIGWYNLGSVAGMALSGEAKVQHPEGTGFTNCAVAGYQIVDKRNKEGYGGANVGGFVGLTNLGLQGCSAVNDIHIEVTYSNSNRNIRTGGMVGNFRGVELADCYSGGSMFSVANGKNNSTKIHIAGIVGGWFMRTKGNMSTLFGTLEAKPSIVNCYTYADLSDANIQKHTSKRPIVTDCDNEDRKGSYFAIQNCYYYPAKRVTYTTQTQPDSNATQMTYEQMTTDLLPKLQEQNDSWGRVTVIDHAGTAVKGKYSFSGGVQELDGKDYPFPTIITQTDLTFGERVNVHYGAWTVGGAYWSEANATINLFSAMQEDGWSYKECTFYPNEDLRLSGKEPVFMVDNDKAEVVEAVQATDGSYQVRVRALKTGTVTVTEQESGADFTLDITARFTVTATPETVILEKGEQTELVLTATADGADAPKDYSTSAELTWSVTASTQSSEDGDAEVLPPDAESAPNVYRITGYGCGAVITAKATYHYHGEDYESRAVVNVQRSGVVGLSDGTQYTQAPVTAEDAGAVQSVSAEYALTSGNRPLCSSSLFLYDTEAAGLLTDVIRERATLTLQAHSDAYPALAVSASNSTSLNSTEGNDFRCLPVTLSYERTEALPATLEDVALTATIERDGVTYTLQLEHIKVTGTEPKMFTLTLKQNAPIGAECAPVELTGREGKAQSIPTCPDVFAVEGFVFQGWNTKADGTGKQINSKDNITFEEDTTLYAQWKRAGTLISLRDGETLICTVTLKEGAKRLYDSLSLPAHNGWTLLGWYSKDEQNRAQTQVAAPDGSLCGSAKGFTEDGGWSSTADAVTLYALWGENASETEQFIQVDTLQAGEAYLLTTVQEGSGMAFGVNNSNASISAQPHETQGYLVKQDGSGELINSYRTIKNDSSAAVWSCDDARSLHNGASYLRLNDNGEGHATATQANATTGWSYDKAKKMPTAVNAQGVKMYFCWGGDKWFVAYPAGDSESKQPVYLFQRATVYETVTLNAEG